MKVLVCGGRDFNDSNQVFWALNCLDGQRSITEVIHGGARGADITGGQWGHQHSLPVRIFAADWQKHGKSAGFIRNKEMLTEGEPDMVIAFTGGKGTEHMVKLSRQYGVHVTQMLHNGTWV